MFPLIEIILGLFVWMALPPLFLKKKKRKPYKRFITIACTILGVVMVGFGIWNLLKYAILQFS